MGAVGSVAFPEEELAATEGCAPPQRGNPFGSLAHIEPVLQRVRNSRGGPKKASRFYCLLFVIPPLPVGLGCSVYQFAEAATKLNIKNVFDAVRAFTHERIKLV